MPDRTLLGRDSRKGRPRWFTWRTVLVAAFGALLMGIAAALGAKYGFTMFVGIPAFVGFAAVLSTSRTRRWTLRALLLLSVGAVLLCGLFALAYAIEGLICIAIGIPLAILGSLGGGFLASSCRRVFWSALRLRVLLGVATLVLGGLFMAESALVPAPAVRPVVTTIEIAAPPELVWRHVVAFSDLPVPTEWYFRTGLAYPLRARIEGSGPGAVRYCEFSTGSFVEPITVWDEPRLLAFDVTHNPAPMVELHPYAHIDAPHLEGHMVSRRGQFALERLPNNHTRLTGTTWYQHGLYPDFYWRLWSDAIIHRIHLRVLKHIKTLAEGQSGVTLNRRPANKPVTD